MKSGETQPVDTQRTTPAQRREPLEDSARRLHRKHLPRNPGGKQKIALDFDDADIYEVINALSDILNINYVIDPAVRGKVNIHTSGEIDKSQLMPIMETIFKINNIAAVKTGNIYKIVPLKEAKSAVPEVGIGTALESMPSRRPGYYSDCTAALHSFSRSDKSYEALYQPGRRYPGIQQGQHPHHRGHLGKCKKAAELYRCDGC